MDKINKPIRELLCQKCGCDYPVWFTDNGLWNKVCGDNVSFLCLNCFAFLAEKQGIESIWRLQKNSVKCSNCGFKDNPTNRSLITLHNKHFPEMPILEMVDRGWIKITDLTNLEEILQELMRFFRTKTLDEFKLKFGYEGELMDKD